MTTSEAGRGVSQGCGVNSCKIFKQLNLRLKLELNTELKMGPEARARQILNMGLQLWLKTKLWLKLGLKQFSIYYFTERLMKLAEFFICILFLHNLSCIFSESIAEFSAVFDFSSWFLEGYRIL